MNQGRLELRRFTSHNIRKTFLWLCDSELRRLFLMSAPPTVDDNLAYWERILVDPSQRVYAIVVDEEHIGNCGFKNIASGNAAGELWIYIGENSWKGKGWGRKALDLLLQEGKRLGIRQIVLHVAAFNHAARRLYTRCGFIEAVMSADESDIWNRRDIEVLRMELKLKTECHRRIALMQPAFLPWQGYFALAAEVDVFVFLDDFQVSRQSFSQRNRLFTAPGKVDWLTVPITHSIGATFQEMEIRNWEKWSVKALRGFQTNYGRTPFFFEVMPMVEEWLTGMTKRKLGELDEEFIVAACRSMEITPEFRHSSEYLCEERRSRRVESTLRQAGAGVYHSAFGSFAYMRDDGVFPLPDIETVFLDYQPLPYPQKGHDGFVPRLSILDAFFNIGFKATRCLIEEGTRWLSWSERAAREDKQSAPEVEDCPFMA